MRDDVKKSDYVIVGSGINSLVCAAILAKRGRSVSVLERNDRIGGCIRSEEITAPGFTHDVMAATFVLFKTSPAYTALAEDLHQRGLVFCDSTSPTGVLLADGRHLIFHQSTDHNVSAFKALCASDGQQHAADMAQIGADADILFSVLGGNLWSWNMLKLLFREGRRRGSRELLALFGEALGSARGWLETAYSSDEIKALWAPWVLHAGLGPESAFSAQIGKIIAFALEQAGAPIIKGGAEHFVHAIRSIIEDHGGEIFVGQDVAEVIVEKTTAKGVRTTGQEEFMAAHGVICSTTPGQLYDRLLKHQSIPSAVRNDLKRFRYGKGNMQIHYALDKPPAWSIPELGQVALLHLTPGLDGVSKATNEAERGMLPEIPTLCVGHPTALDPSRCPEGKAILWLQLPETPRQIKGDAATEIDPPYDGQWTNEIKERYADRAQSILESHIAGFGTSVLERKVYSPADLEAININLVGGDPYGGFCGLDQYFLWRPLKSSINHTTCINHLHHIGASTHPGPGLGGGSGFLLAQSLK